MKVKGHLDDQGVDAKKEYVRSTRRTGPSAGAPPDRKVAALVEPAAYRFVSQFDLLITFSL